MLKVVGASWLQTKIICYGLSCLALLAILTLFLGEFEKEDDDGNFAATVFWEESTQNYHIEFWGQGNDLQELPTGVARAYFRQDVYTTGWSHLEIETDESYSDEMQAFAAGLLEGALTWQQIYSHYINLIERPCRGAAEKDCEKLKDHLELAANVMKKKVDELEDEDPFWHHVGLFYAQIDGMIMGWKHGVKRIQKEEDYIMEEDDFLWLNALSDLKEIKKYLNMTIDEVELADQLPGSASSFIKLVNDTHHNNGRKMFVAHNTAGNYNSMLRILKRYKFRFHKTLAANSSRTPGVVIEIPSYPAAVSSHDQMYIVTGEDNKHMLSVTGTTVNNFNPDLWKFVGIIHQVQIGPRVLAASRLADNATHWTHIFAQSNSGTACKQWLVADFIQLDRAEVCNGSETDSSAEYVSHVYKLKELKHTVVRRERSCGSGGLVMLVEQVPSRTHSADISNTLLEKGQVATFGLPYFQDIAEATNIHEMEEKYGSIFSIHLSPKAQIFNHRGANATNVRQILSMMRSTNKTNITDPMVSTHVCNRQKLLAVKLLCQEREKKYWYTLGVRGDLLKNVSAPFGVIDTKVFSGNSDGKVLEFSAISGPSYNAMTHKPTPRPAIFQNKATRNLKTPVIENQIKEDETKLKDIKPFDWATSSFNETSSHESHPVKFDFTPNSPTWHW